MYTIYALVDPRDKKARYVGVTKDVYKRFWEHTNVPSNRQVFTWIETCRAVNLMIHMITLEQVESKDQALKREEYWIKHYSSLGMPLCNKRGISLNLVIIPTQYETPMVVPAPEETESQAIEKVYSAYQQSGRKSARTISQLTGYGKDKVNYLLNVLVQAGKIRRPYDGHPWHDRRIKQTDR